MHITPHAADVFVAASVRLQFCFLVLVYTAMYLLERRSRSHTLDPEVAFQTFLD